MCDEYVTKEVYFKLRENDAKLPLNLCEMYKVNKIETAFNKNLII